MSIIGTVIRPWGLYGALALSAALGSGLVVQTLRVSAVKQSLTAEQKARAIERAQAEESARIASENYRREEQRRINAQQEAINAAEQKATQARADLALADAAAGRLRERVAALVAAARQAAINPQTAEPGPPATDASMVLADVFGRCVTRVRQLAELADQRGTAGATCERIGDEITTKE